MQEMVPQICDLIPVPPDIRNLASLYKFKNKINSAQLASAPVAYIRGLLIIYAW